VAACATVDDAKRDHEFSNESSYGGFSLADFDAAWVERFPQAALALAESHLPQDESALLGRNLQWGAMYSPRFQLGAGLALRVALVADEAAAATASLAAVEVGFSTMEASGRMPSTLPVSFSQQPSEADVASAAAFFLGDACSALRVLSEAPEYASVASRVENLRNQSTLAVTWLAEQSALLWQLDGDAPNRLLHNALAFAACSAFSDTVDYTDVAEEFLAGALALEEQGVFSEESGFDTNYQAVNHYIAMELLHTIPLSGGASLESALLAGMALLEARVSADGRIDSTGNTRTCGGCENFLPGDPPKQLGVEAFFRGLAYPAVYSASPEAMAAADRFVGWVATGPTTSCFVKDGSESLVELDVDSACPGAEQP
jgi:hypothetical protein